MKFDLKDMNRKELEKLQSDVEKALTKVVDKEKKDARDAIMKTAASFGFTPEEMLEFSSGPKVRKTKPKAPGKPKYRNPANGDETWTGKGRPPKWFVDATTAGTPRESMEIKD
jgi:DNA-binding protein H-NS